MSRSATRHFCRAQIFVCRPDGDAVAPGGQRQVARASELQLGPDSRLKDELEPRRLRERGCPVERCGISELARGLFAHDDAARPAHFLN
eukprot:scaffold17815_cov112-Isochrysis_galbana.AAC.5